MASMAVTATRASGTEPGHAARSPAAQPESVNREQLAMLTLAEANQAITAAMARAQKMKMKIAVSYVTKQGILLLSSGWTESLQN